MKLLRASDHKRMPWKNGKGETVEIAVFPQGATVENFDWRISTATVAEDGPFSVFDGIDRTLSVLTGEGITLAVAGNEEIDLRQDTAPHSFAADVVTSARLIGGPITDLNVMTRRGRWDHAVTLQTGAADAIAAPVSGTVVVVFMDPCTIVGGAAAAIEIASLDAILLEPGDDPVRLTGDDGVRLFIIRLGLAKTV